MRSTATMDDVRAVLAQAFVAEGIDLGELETLRLRDNGSAVHYVLARMKGWTLGQKVVIMLGSILARRMERGNSKSCTY